MTTERINVTAAWRIAQCNSTFKMTFKNPVDMNKAYEAMKNAIEEIGCDSWKPMLTDLWLQDLADCTSKDCFKIISALTSNSFADYIPAMCKAVAEAFPEIEFEGCADYDDLKCYYVHTFDFTYSKNALQIKSDLREDECGYFCPECGELVANIDEEFDSDEIECMDCGEIVSVSELEKREPEITTTTIIIK